MIAKKKIGILVGVVVLVGVVTIFLFGRPSEGKIIDKMRSKYKFTSDEYSLKVIEIVKIDADKDLDAWRANPACDYVAWVEVTSIRSNESLRVQLGRFNDPREWRKTTAQNESERREIRGILNRIKAM